MKKIVDEAIVLRRVNFGEKDRVVTVLAKHSGKIAVFAKSARAQNSKLSAGIELFNINEITFIEGKSHLKTLTSTRIINYNDKIVADLQKTSQSFEFLKLINKIVEDNHGQEYYTSLKTYFIFLNDDNYDCRLVEAWLGLKILLLLGVMPELSAETKDAEKYIFDFEKQIFLANDKGKFAKNDIKILRLLIQNPQPIKFTSETGSEDFLFGFVNSLIESNVNL